MTLIIKKNIDTMLMFYSVYYFIIIIIIICLDPTSSLRQYFNLYDAFSQRDGERTRNNRREKKMSKQNSIRTHCKHSRPLSYYHPNTNWKMDYERVGGGEEDIQTGSGIEYVAF